MQTRRLGKSAAAGVSRGLKQKDPNSHSARVRVPTQNLAGGWKKLIHTPVIPQATSPSHTSLQRPGAEGVQDAGTGMKHILVLSSGARRQTATVRQTSRTSKELRCRGS